MNQDELRNLKVDKTVDARGMACPGPLLEAKKAISMVKGFHDKKRCARVTAIFKTLAHPQRLLIICCLCQKELTVGELQKECGAPQSVISQQLTRLRLEGIVKSRRTGIHVHYRIANAQLPELIQNLEKMFHG